MTSSLKLKLIQHIKRIILICCIFFSSCKEKKIENIYLNDESEYNKYSDVFEYEKSILIKDAVNFGQDVEVIVTENQIIFVDKEYTNQVDYYNFNGDLLFKIKPGIGGPDEFIEATDATYDFDNDILYLFSEEQYKIFGFDVNGKLVKNTSIETSFYIHEIEHLKDEVFVLFAAQDKAGEDQVHVYDFEKNETKLRFMKGFFKNIFLSNETNLWKDHINNKVYIAPYFTNYIYEVSSNFQLDSTYIEGSLELSRVENLTDFNKLKNYAFNTNSDYFIGMHKATSSLRTFIYYNSKLDNGALYLKNLNNGILLDPNQTKNDLLTTDKTVGFFVHLDKDKAYSLNSSEYFDNDEEAKNELISYFGENSKEYINTGKYSVLHIYNIKK